ncbi:Similar to glycosyltransferase [Xenorhabdus nematophila str. Anatoliense]|nr:Similar to glycosyltransferase [Xenorhabdus nematophila str. Anatoliense]
MKQKMNILITNFHKGKGGGHTTYIKSLLSDDRNKVHYHVACPNTSKLYIELNSANFNKLLSIDFTFKINTALNIYKNIKTLRQYILDNNIKIIHTNGSSDLKTIILCKKIYRLKIKIIYTKHNNYKISFSTKMILSRYCDKIIFVSDNQFESFKLLFTTNKSIVIKNGIDTNFWVRYHYPFSEINNKINLVSSAGTAEHKGWHLLVKALIEHPHLQDFFSITILGRTPSPDDIIKLIGRTINDLDVTFTGFIDDKKKQIEIISQKNIGFVLSTNCETISFACREMMSLSLPVIVSDYSGLPENINHGVNGWITKKNDINSIRNILEEISRLPIDTIRNMGFEARQKAISEFDVNTMQKKTVQLYLANKK